MHDDHHRWEERYRTLRTSATTPSPFIVAHADLAGCCVLDVAGGSGRNALFLARRGAHVEIIDIAFSGLQQALQISRAEGLSVAAIQADLDTYPLPQNRYDSVVNVRYLQRSLLGPLQQAVKPGGVVLFETFLIEQQKIGHPRNPAFLLEHDELRRAFADFHILEYREGLLDGDPPAYLAQLVARRPSTPN